METNATVSAAPAGNPGVVYGVIAGIATVLFTLMLYLGGVSWFTSPVAWLGFVIIIVFAVLAPIKQKRLNSGYLEFKEALKISFTVFTIGTLISTLFNYVLFNFIDIPFREAYAQEMAKKSGEMMKNFGAPQEEIDKAVEKAMSADNYSIGNMLLGTAFILIIFFLFSLLIAAIVKKKRPEFPAPAI